MGTHQFAVIVQKTAILKIMQHTVIWLFSNDHVLYHILRYKIY